MHRYKSHKRYSKLGEFGHSASRFSYGQRYNSKRYQSYQVRSLLLTAKQTGQVSYVTAISNLVLIGNGNIRTSPAGVRIYCGLSKLCKQTSDYEIGHFLEVHRHIRTIFNPWFFRTLCMFILSPLFSTLAIASSVRILFAIAMKVTWHRVHSISIILISFVTIQFKRLLSLTGHCQQQELVLFLKHKDKNTQHKTKCGW